MNELKFFLEGLPSGFEMAFIYSIMVMGVYITYKILDFPDLSVDGTFPLGGFVFAAFALSPHGFFGVTSPIVGLILSALAGALAGYATGYLHVEKKIDKLLSGILVMTALYSINSRVVGSPNVFITPERSIYEVVTYEKHFLIFALFSISVSISAGNSTRFYSPILYRCPLIWTSLNQVQIIFVGKFVSQ